MKLIEYLPEFMRKISQLMLLTEAEQPDFDELDANGDTIQNEMFVDTATDYGLSRFEKIYGISSNTGDDMDFRKYRLMLKIMGSKRITLSETLDKIMGSGNYRLNFYIDEMRLEVRVTVKNSKYVSEIYKQLDRIVPCNVMLDIGVLYTSHGMLSKYSDSQLAAYTHNEIKTMASQI